MPHFVAISMALEEEVLDGLEILYTYLVVVSRAVGTAWQGYNRISPVGKLVDALVQSGNLCHLAGLYFPTSLCGISRAGSAHCLTSVPLTERCQLPEHLSLRKISPTVSARVNSDDTQRIQNIIQYTSLNCLNTV